MAVRIRMVLLAQPPHFERPAVIIVVRIGGSLTTYLTTLAQYQAKANSVAKF